VFSAPGSHTKIIASMDQESQAYLLDASSVSGPPDFLAHKTKRRQRQTNTVTTIYQQPRVLKPVSITTTEITLGGDEERLPATESLFPSTGQLTNIIIYYNR
jgi:hypothetical protein